MRGSSGTLRAVVCDRSAAGEGEGAKTRVWLAEGRRPEPTKDFLEYSLPRARVAPGIIDRRKRPDLRFARCARHTYSAVDFI